MGLNRVDSEAQELSKRYREVCADLNLDKTAQDEAWQSFQRIGINYTLEGDKLHWLACALYVSCRKGVTPTVGGRGGYVEGNCVSLTRLLRSCKLSLVQFFSKMKKWSDMANLPHEMRNKIEHLERNFNVSTVIFKKFRPIFLDMFKDPSASPAKPTKNRKQSRKQSITSNDIFSFCWTLFIHVKANFTAISDDLVNSYHLLLACIDFCYSNALVAENAKDLLSSLFSELPDGFDEAEFKAPDSVGCIIQSLCSKWDGIYVDAKGIKEHWWKPCLKRMVEKRVLKCKNNPQANLLGFFDLTNYEANFKSIMKEYDQYVLNIGDFDERIFLCENAHQELGTPQTTADELSEKMLEKQSLKQHMEETKTLTPTTPLSNRHYLKNREPIGSVTPVSSATQTVSQLHSLLLGCKDEPTPLLLEIFKECTVNPQDAILNRVKEMSDKFLVAYSQPLNDDQYEPPYPVQTNDFAKKRLELGISLYYKTLENIMKREKKRLPANKLGETLYSLLSHEMLHVSLFACCLEIVLYSYNSKRTFPWIIEVMSDLNDLHFQPFHFYKVIELLIRDEDGLSRGAVKHLNSIEEQVLENMAWKSDSALWEAIKSHGSVPSCQDVALPNQGGNDTNPVLASPSSAIKRLSRDVFASPLPNSTAYERFSSPVNPAAKRRLFDAGHQAPNGNAPDFVNLSSATQQLIQIQIPAQSPSGEVRFFQMPAYAYTIPSQAPVSEANTSASSHNSEQAKPKAGPLGLFFRKVYHLAWLRLRDLCDRLNITEEDLRRKIWTCFETSLKSHTDLMRDRHLDQLAMCAIYSMCKVTRHDQSFQDIMKSYRLQPQAQSHIYRSVLLSNRSRRNSASSDNSRNSGSCSPVCSQEEKERIRSSSTLPVPHPSSQPPTPTRLAGTGSQFDFGEERGDLIMFYNQIYVPELKKYIMKFSLENASPLLSPLPRLSANPVSPFRRISTRHTLYISPLKNANFPPSPNRPMSYSFLRSPAKELRAINQMMKSNASGNEKKVSKRILQDDCSESENSPTKRVCPDPALFRSKIQNIFSERQGTAASEDSSSALADHGNGSSSAE